MEERLLKSKQVQEYVGFSEGKIYQLMNKNEFPKCIKIGGNTLWKYTEIQKYIKKMIKEYEEQENLNNEKTA